MGETIIWHGRSSQWINWKKFLVAGFIFLVCISLAFSYHMIFIIGALGALGKITYDYFYVHQSTYTLTDQRIKREVGLISRTTFEVELFRVQDVLLVEPLFYRMFKLGNIRLASSQRTTDFMFLEAIENPKELREKIREISQNSRSYRGIREFDVY